MLDPRAKLLPAPIVHTGFTSFAALPAANEEGTATGIEIRLGQVEGLAYSKPRAPQHNDQAADPRTVDTVAGLAHHRHDLLHSRGIGRVAQPLVTRWAA
jgi:hypothetical protein